MAGGGGGGVGLRALAIRFGMPCFVRMQLLAPSSPTQPNVLLCTPPALSRPRTVRAAAREPLFRAPHCHGRPLPPARRYRQEDHSVLGARVPTPNPGERRHCPRRRCRLLCGRRRQWGWRRQCRRRRRGGGDGARSSPRNHGGANPAPLPDIALLLELLEFCLSDCPSPPGERPPDDGTEAAGAGGGGGGAGAAEVGDENEVEANARNVREAQEARMVRLNLFCFVLVWFGLVTFGLVWLRLVWLG